MLIDVSEMCISSPSIVIQFWSISICLVSQYYKQASRQGSHPKINSIKVNKDTHTVNSSHSVNKNNTNNYPTNQEEIVEQVLSDHHAPVGFRKGFFFKKG
jgi:hypothetical protein